MRAVFLSLFLAVLALAVGCGGGSSSSTTGTGGGGGGGGSNPSNTLALSVNGGPSVSNGSIYPNAAFASAKICAPGTSNCVTIDNLLVDTGSTGLRVFDTAVASLNLPAVNASSGSAAYDCVSFVDQTFMWGHVEKADVTLGSETASGTPIQVISSSSSGIPSSCSNGGTNDNTAARLGANGILGVGLEPTDCFYGGGSVCDPSAGLSSPPTPAYYTCSGGSCSPVFIATSNQVANPVALFATDNNGVIVELPAASSPAASMSGTLIFGIGTESNNQLASSATIFTLACNAFTTVLDGHSYGVTNDTTCAGPGSFIDSGSNGLYFPNAPKLPQCPSNTAAGNLSDFYCPASTDKLSATNKGVDASSKSTSFSVGNAETLFTSASTDSDPVQPTLAGLNPTGVGFDWGLPFFYGVKVYVAMDAQRPPSGAPPAPWWAY